MSVPRHIQKEIEAVAAIEQQLQTAPAPTSTDAPEASPAPAPVPEPRNEPDTLVDPAPSPTPDPALAPDVPEEKWEVKYKRLQGKFDAEVPRLHRENKDLRQIIEHLQQQVAQLQAAPPAPAPKAEGKTQPAPLVTPEDIDTYGEELIDLQRRIAREGYAEFQAAIDALRQEKTELQARLDALAGNSFETKLRTVVPDFDAINADPRWIAWLDEVDPMLRAPRRIAAQTAFDQQDADAVKHYVELFKRSTGDATQTQRQAELRKQVQPARTGASSASGQQPKFYTAAEADAVWSTIQRLQARGQDDQARELEREISQAYTEGRVGA